MSEVDDSFSLRAQSRPSGICEGGREIRLAGPTVLALDLNGDYSSANVSSLYFKERIKVCNEQSTVHHAAALHWHCGSKRCHGSWSQQTRGCIRNIR